VYMQESQWLFIHINNTVTTRDHCYVQVSLKDREGNTVEEIVENALLSDRNFRDLSSLLIGLTAARKLGIRRILILTNNIFLGTIIKNGQGKDCWDCFGFYPDLKGLIGSFEEVEVNVVNRGEQFKPESRANELWMVNSAVFPNPERTSYGLGNSAVFP
jgi:hypothetical protein